MEESIHRLSAKQFRDYCLHDVTRAERILDLLFNSDQTLPDIVETIRMYLTGGETFEDFAREGIGLSVRMMMMSELISVRKFDNHPVCGLVWTDSCISYRCGTCAINPCMR